MGHIIGIDLGTTNSVVSFLEGNRPVVIPNSEGNRTTPSVVLYKSVDEIIVGEFAKRQIVANPTHTVHSIKRFIGRRYNEIHDMAEQVQYKIVDDPDNDRVLLDLGWAKVSPEKVSSEILRKMKSSAEDFLAEEVGQAVITVPAHFNDSQRSRTKEAAETAGLEVIRVVNEPTAAALAYGLNQNKSERVAVFDFGGGTFDISILDLDENLFEVLSTNGDAYLGGDNVDYCIFKFIREEIKKETGIDLITEPKAVQRVRESAEKVKCELSSMEATTISLPFIVSDDEGPKHFNRELTRKEFNAMAMPLFEQLFPPCRNAIMDAGLTPADIDTVLMVGGSTRIPKVQEMVAEFFQKEPYKSINPDEVVAMGAAIQGAVVNGSLIEVLLLDVTPLSLGIELADDIFSVIIPRNSNIPTTASKKFTTVTDNQRNVYIHVLQGERKRAGQNRSLAHFRLMDIPPAPKEVPEVEVQFNIDANGILNVNATDLTSGTSKEVKIQSYQQDAIAQDAEKEIRDAEEKRAEDMEHIHNIQSKDKAVHVLDLFREFISNEEEMIDKDDLSTMQEFMISMEEAIDKNDFEAMDQWSRALWNVSEKYKSDMKKYISSDEK